MIRRYAFKNFYSFLEETEVSFLANQQVPDSNQLMASEEGQRIAKVVTVLGHNASGKTKVLMPLAFMAWFMGRSFQDTAPGASIPIEPHLASDSDKVTLELEFTLLNGSQVFRYQLTLSQTQVYREALYKKDKRFAYVFIREWNEESAQYDVKQKDFGLKPSQAKKARKNVSLISTAAQYDISFAQEITFFAATVSANVTMIGKRYMDENLLGESTWFYSQNQDYLNMLNEHITRLDVGVDTIHIEKINVPDEGIRLVPICKHQSMGREFFLPLLSESSGTRGVYSVLRYILPVLSSGGIAVLDEMESELHPQMVLEIMRMFTDSDSNPHGAQLLMATHSLEVLQRVEKNQIYLVEKNDCVSEAWRLDEMKGVRRDENIYARYMAGAYGAVPNID